VRRVVRIAGRTGTRLRDRTRTVRYRVLEIARASRSHVSQGQERLKACYRKVLYHTARVVGQAQALRPGDRHRGEARPGRDRTAQVADRSGLPRAQPGK